MEGDVRKSLLDECEYHAWPPRKYGGQHVTQRPGVLVVHVRSGAAVVVASERSQLNCVKLAEERILLLLATLPWSTT